MIKIDFRLQNTRKISNGNSFNYQFVFIKDINNLTIFEKPLIKRQ